MNDILKGYKRISCEIFIYENGIRIPVEPEDLRLLEVKEVLIVENFKKESKDETSS